MFPKIRSKIEHELANYIQKANKECSLKRISPLIFNSIKEFASRPGKRIRPLLFVAGYVGFKPKIPQGLYTSAASIELLHDFMLVHDDIIDKSDTRRGKPSMHQKFSDYLSSYKQIKFEGKDLAIVIGDIIYALSIDAFLAIKTNPSDKENALKRLLKTSIYTASGEFIELLSGTKDISDISKADIYKIYDLKTADYTFAAPLSIGAMLAGARKTQIERLHKYGLCLGRAFQIKDDITGIFGDEKKIGKPSLTDLREAKKTILIWYAYNHTSKKNKSLIRGIFTKNDVDKKDLSKIKKIIINSGSLDFAKNEVTRLIKKAQNLLLYSQMHTPQKVSLWAYSKEILNL